MTETQRKHADSTTAHVEAVWPYLRVMVPLDNNTGDAGVPRARPISPEGSTSASTGLITVTGILSARRVTYSGAKRHHSQGRRLGGGGWGKGDRARLV